MKKIALIFVIGFMINLMGCHVMSAFGKDLQQAGEAIEKKAEK